MNNFYKISAIQINPQFGDIENNLEKIESLFPDNSDLVVLPELCTTGYQFSDKSELSNLAENINNSKSVNFFRTLAVKYNTNIIAGIAEENNGKFYNSAIIVTKEGNMSVYRKINLFYQENEFFESGKVLPPVIEMGSIKVGVMICFDWMFPEISRSLALRGADVIAHPSNLVLPWCQDAMLTRSIENRVFTVTANRFGSESRWENEAMTFTGKSQITSPLGNRLIQASSDSETVISADIDPKMSKDKSYNKYNNLNKMVKNINIIQETHKKQD